MRPIMFRGISYESNQWVYGGFYEWNDKVWIVQKDIWDEPRETKHTISSWLIEVDPKTVAQYTGLKDKNGKEIYEGDYDVNYDMVRWCDKRAGWAMASYDFESKEFIECHCYNCAGDFEITEDEIEIIGNIYEGETK